MTLTPTRKYTIELCDCREGDYRGEVSVFYERGHQSVVCSNCGKLPPELIATHIPDDHRIELDVIHELDEYTTRLYRVTMPPE